ncbi:polyamine ABC transporter permease [Skermanella stibiiresistens SB22]|uniref:Polyamine ABC transporter permease n=1 Tax=Skermanella stibiiresistens SB22 TaxID=1385369 RepID=W9H0E4_9PROT|nr:ABC transporter permease [Skermanella stibiiresistens]EWY38316.1 polyamine ABC transporter permease [Skermanella stibiiresistens SB22]
MVGSTTVGFRVLVTGLYLFLLAPILIVVPLSFSDDNILTFPPTSWGVRWYAQMFEHQALVNAFQVSLSLAAIVTVLSLAAGIPAAYALHRFRFRGRDALMNLFTAPLLLPSIVLGLSILLVFVKLQLLATFVGLVVAHLIVTTPYVVRIMSTALTTLPPSVEEAATMLGASPLVVFRRVTLPLMMPGLVASAALSFLLSFDEVVISLFITGPHITTLPVEIFNYVESRTDPLIAAVSVVLVAATLLVVLLVERSLGLSKAMGK